ncbi:protein translocase subunit SecF [Paracoccus sp. S-4012]|uniref:protein translocase subunit SecF n=1 Tax=Paracoccus sp. S-4012 TaxID=2665648 RepID=UPI0012B0086D|nr:protein translocase subunit SecF [Paracoccus sp. S-4012]MRX49405.1 protein translocase subunit SecF [Paracoccus sp. S-4012]
MRLLKLVPDDTNINFFRWMWLTSGVSFALMIASVIVLFINGLNFGIDFRGGTTIRAESTNAVDVGDYRNQLDDLGLTDVSITEVFDPTFGERSVVQIRLGARQDAEAVTPAELDTIHAALQEIDPAVTFTAVESVGPKVSGELIQTAFLAVGAAALGILLYIWLRFEWQFAVGGVVALIHDVLITVGIFSLFQLRFDLSTIAALLTILGYSINDTVVIFDRLRENLMKFKTTPLIDIMNLTVNETLSRTVMTSLTTALALGALLVFGGDVIRGFVFAMLFGVVIGTYSTVYLAKNIVLQLGVKRDWSKKVHDPEREVAEGSPFSDLP